MADSRPFPDTGDSPDVEPSGGSAAGTPRWVKVFGAIALAVVLLFAILLLTGRGGGHGPGRHAPSGGTTTVGVHTPPPGVTHGEEQP